MGYGMMENWKDRPGVVMFNAIVKQLYESSDDHGNEEFWSDGEKVLVRDEAKANALADLIDAAAGYGITCTGYYDPEEDARLNLTDRYTGYHYVDI